MQVIKKIKVFLSIFALALIVAPNANSTEECLKEQAELFLNLTWPWMILS